SEGIVEVLSNRALCPESGFRDWYDFQDELRDLCFSVRKTANGKRRRAKDMAHRAERIASLCDLRFYALKADHQEGSHSSGACPRGSNAQPAGSLLCCVVLRDSCPQDAPA